MVSITPKRLLRQPSPWIAVNAAILTALDIEAEYEKIGLRFSQQKAGQRGWRACFALGRDERRPSAGINIKTGYYTDFGDGCSLSFFDAMTEFGGFPTWQDARDHFARQAGVPLPISAVL